MLKRVYDDVGRQVWRGNKQRVQDDVINEPGMGGGAINLARGRKATFKIRRC